MSLIQRQSFIISGEITGSLSAMALMYFSFDLSSGAGETSNTRATRLLLPLPNGTTTRIPADILPERLSGTR